MSPFEAFCKYVAVKRHFSPGSTYDYHRYGGKLTLSRSSFDSRSDRYFFDKLAKIPDLENFLVANLSYSPKTWVGDLFTEEAHERYSKWMRAVGSLTYTTKQQMAQFSGAFNSVFTFRDGKHPPALSAMLAGSLSPEVLAAIDSVINFTKHWSERQWDPTVRGAVHLIGKLKGFVTFHPDTLKRELKKIFDPQEDEKLTA